MDEDFNLKGAVRIAYFTSEAEGRERWTELEVWFQPSRAGGKKQWFARSFGHTRIDGETTRKTVLPAGTLARALTLFEDNTPGRSIKTQALDWLDENRDLVEGKPDAAAIADDKHALAYLFGDKALLKDQADALGLGESTLRMQLKNGTDVRIALRSILPFLDVDAFRRARGIAL